MDSSSIQLRAVLDVKQGKPTCVLLQAVYSGDGEVCRMFESRHWLTSPTPDMHMVTGTREEFRRLADIANGRA